MNFKQQNDIVYTSNNSIIMQGMEEFTLCPCSTKGLSPDPVWDP